MDLNATDHEQDRRTPHPPEPSAPILAADRDRELRGIVIADGGESAAPARRPRIAAFIWAEREEAQPTLPFGRWKAAS